MDIVAKSLIFAAEKHKDQLYGKDQPFIVHPTQTARILLSIPALRDDLNLISAAYLHDTLEDTETTYEELVENFNEDIASLVKEVTEEGYNLFPNLKTIRGVMLKFADRLSNLSSMEDWKDHRKKKYVFEKSKFWKP